jgi:hypothetical protein
MPQPAAPVCWLLAEQLSAGMVFGTAVLYLAAWLYEYSVPVRGELDGYYRRRDPYF